MSDRSIHTALLTLTLVLLFTSLCPAGKPPANPEEWKWDFGRMARMESPAGWTGPDPGFLRVSDDRVEGDKSLEVELSVDASRHLRIDRNFIDGWSKGIENMMAMAMKNVDFTPYRTITFSFKADLNTDAAMLFRIYDRTGGWLDWTIPGAATTNNWRKVILSVPPAPGELVDIRAIGGLMFEIRATDKPVSGRVWFDDLQFITDTTAGGLSANNHPTADRDYNYTRDYPKLDIPDAFPTRDVHMCLNMSPVELTMWECNGDKAVRQLEEEMKRFAGLSNVGICINPGTQRDILEVPGYIENSRKAFVQVAEWCEQRGIKFWQMAGCEGHHFLPPETIFAVMDAAPENFMGVLFAESSVDTNNNVGHVVTLLERLSPAGKKVLYFQQSSYWMGIMHPHGKDFIKRIMAPEYRDAFVPMWENLLPSCQGLCYGTTMGFWRGGLTNHWGVSAQSWGYANMNFGGTSDMPANWWFRMFLESVASGATYIEIEPIWPFDGENTEGQIRHTKQWAHNLSWIGRLRAQVQIDVDPCDQIRALRYFDKLLTAGIVRPPAKPEYASTLAHVALKVVPSDKSYKWGMIRRCLDTDWWQMGDCPTSWEMSVQVQDDEIFRPLYNSSHYYDQTIPETPFGHVAIVPSSATLPDSVRVIETDGHGIRQNGRWLKPKPSQEIVAEVYEEAAGALPFRAAGCYLAVAQVAPKAYIAYLIDPEERFPVGVSTSLKINLDGRWRCIDALNHQELAVTNSSVRVEIPAAGYRILYIQKQ